MGPIFIKVTFKNLSIIGPTRKIIPLTTRPSHLKNLLTNSTKLTRHNCQTVTARCVVSKGMND